MVIPRFCFLLLSVNSWVIFIFLFFNFGVPLVLVLFHVNVLLNFYRNDNDTFYCMFHCSIVNVSNLDKNIVVHKKKRF